MRYVSIDDAKPGMRLAYELFDANNRIMIGSNKALTETLIMRLRDLGFKGIYIDDEMTTDIVVEPVISQELREAGIACMKEQNIDRCIEIAKSIVDDADNMQIVLLLSIVSLVTCAVQFLFGKVVAGHYGQRISGGQAIGQKNTVLAIWMSLAYLHPLSAVAPGAYVLWQNVVNSYQLWKKRHKELAAAAVAEQTK